MKKYDLWLASYENLGIGLATRRFLKNVFGDAKGVYEASKKEIEAIREIDDNKKEVLLRDRQPLSELEAKYNELGKKNIRIVSEWEEDYPSRLKSIKNPPDVLFVKGRLPNEDKLTVSIVGSRHATSYGLKVTEYLTSALAKRNVQIISGMAYGIDSCAHSIALQEQVDTFAVMGCGIDICYPAEKIELYECIRETGGIISEYPIGVPPLAYRFPMRNRIIAGLSDIVIVVEAREKSGSLITANYALEQGKDVYVVPGRIDDLNSIGCNKLWFDGAIPIMSIETIFEGSVFKNALYIEETQKPNIEKILANDEKKGIASKSDMVYSCLGLHPKGVDELVKNTGLSPEDVTLSLVEMQLEKRIEEVFRGFYIKKI